MSLEIVEEHDCDSSGGGRCTSKVDYCYCDSCLEEIKGQAYEEGKKAGREEAELERKG